MLNSCWTNAADRITSPLGRHHGGSAMCSTAPITHHSSHFIIRHLFCRTSAVLFSKWKWWASNEQDNDRSQSVHCKVAAPRNFFFFFCVRFVRLKLKFQMTSFHFNLSCDTNTFIFMIGAVRRYATAQRPGDADCCFIPSHVEPLCLQVKHGRRFIAGPDQWSSGTKYLPWSFHATFNKAASTSSRQMELKRICSCMFCHFYLDVVQRSSSSWCHNSQCCGQTSTFIVENCVDIFCSWERTETTRKFGLWHETSFYKVEPAPRFLFTNPLQFVDFVLSISQQRRFLCSKIITSVLNLWPIKYGANSYDWEA